MANLYMSRIGSDPTRNIEHYDDRTVFQTKEWLEFIARAQGAEMVVAAVSDGTRAVGMFTGLVINKAGFRILGSPFPGWTTAYMGFNLEQPVSRGEALRALERFAFKELGCIHIEIMDRRLQPEDYESAGYSYTLFSGYEIDLTQSEDDIFMAMEPACRRGIRKGIRDGVSIEIARDSSFVDEYYQQLKDVFAKQNLVPTYSKERVATMIECMLPTGYLLLLKANDAAGHCIATGIFPAMNDTMYFWGGASWREFQHLRPNEALQWFAMRYWRTRNIAKYDMGGAGQYKRKYGGYHIAVPWARKSRYPLVDGMRTCCRYVFKIRQRVAGFMKDGESLETPIQLLY